MRYLKLFNDFDLIEEARRWITDPIRTQIENFVNKYKGREDRIFVSYRSGEYVSFINPKNKFNTPTGIYTYPWKGYFDKKFDVAKNSALPDYKNIVPFTGSQTTRFIYLYKVKDDVFLIDNETTYEEILPYAKKLKDIFGEDKLLIKYLESENTYVEWSDNPYLHGQPCDVCGGDKEFQCPECDGKGYFNDGDETECDYCYGTGKMECGECDGTGFREEYTQLISAKIFWVLLYDLITKTKVKGQIQTKFTNICNRIGIDGFVDLGDGYIHPNETHQAVLLKGRSIMEDYVSISLDTDTQTIQLANSMMSANTIELFKIIRLKLREIDYDKISRHMKAENLLDEFIDNVLANILEIKESDILELPGGSFIGLNHYDLDSKKINIQSAIIKGLKYLIKNLPEGEQSRLKYKFPEIK
jgi:hypothetical protein